MYIVVPSYKFNNGNLEPQNLQVLEVSKDREVVFSGDKEASIKRCKFYNSGGGFAGWTPSFILKSTGVVYQ